MKYVFNKIIFALFFNLLFTSLSAQGYLSTNISNSALSYNESPQTNPKENLQKIYLSQNQVWINTKGICVDLEDMPFLLTVDSLFCDEGGIHIYSFQFKAAIWATRKLSRLANRKVAHIINMGRFSIHQPRGFGAAEIAALNWKEYIYNKRWTSLWA